MVGPVLKFDNFKKNAFLDDFFDVGGPTEPTAGGGRILPQNCDYLEEEAVGAQTLLGAKNN